MTDTAKIFMNGRSQAVRLPAAYRFDAKEVSIRRDPKTGEVILSPRTRPADWGNFFERVAENAKKYPEEYQNFLVDREQGPAQERSLF